MPGKNPPTGEGSQCFLPSPLHCPPKVIMIPKQTRAVEQTKTFLACTVKQLCTGSGVPPLLPLWGLVCVGLAASLCPPKGSSDLGVGAPYRILSRRGQQCSCGKGLSTVLCPPEGSTAYGVGLQYRVVSTRRHHCGWGGGLQYLVVSTRGLLFLGKAKEAEYRVVSTIGQ